MKQYTFRGSEIFSNPSVTEAFKRCYEEHGFAVVTEVISEADAAVLRGLADELAAARKAEGLSPYTTHYMLHETDPRALAMARSADFVRKADFLLNGEAHIIHSHIDYKQPGAEEYLPHQDNFYNQADPADGILACWVGLDAARADNGALYVYPGTHKEPILPVGRNWPYLIKLSPMILSNILRRALGTSKKGATGNITRFITARVPSKYSRLVAEVPARTAIFFHGNLVHGSTANTTDRFRLTFLVNYLRAGTRFKRGLFAARKLTSAR